MMTLVYIITAIFIAWIWVDYYRLIDIFERESLIYFIVVFLLGCTSVLIVFGLDDLILSKIPFHLNGSFINDFLYSTFRIGAVEELAKIVPFIIFYYLFKSQLNEPIDYLAYICVGALGFSAIENILYFQKGGLEIINKRGILASVGHMCDSSLIAYGIIRTKFAEKHNGIFTVSLFFFLASLSHGLYDFWLIYEGIKHGGVFITILYFFVTVSIFATILNNALNNSSFFTYKKVIDSNKVLSRLLLYYGILFIFQLIFLTFLEDLIYGLLTFFWELITTGFIILITCVRLSRFKLIKDRWNRIKLELPFTLVSTYSYANNTHSTRFSIKGESFNEAYINIFYEEYFTLHPLSQRNTYFGNARLSYIEKKVFLKNDDTYYLAKIFVDDKDGHHEIMLLKPKTHSITMVNEQYPIVAVLEFNDDSDLESNQLTAKSFSFKEWAYLKPHLVEKFN